MIAQLAPHSLGFAFLVSLIVAISTMTLAFGLGLVRGRVRDVDVFWPLGFLAIAIATWFESAHRHDASALVPLMLVVIWSLRLSGYLAWRSRGEGEDVRYRDLVRERKGMKRIGRLLVVVYGLQALMMVIVASPLVVAITQHSALGPLGLLGIIACVSGIIFETTADWQLSRFKAHGERGVLASGLWAHSRHPNYFGEAVVWWGFFLLAVSSVYGLFTIISPVVMTWLLVKVSGRDLLERHLVATKLEYRSYVEQVPSFIPRWKAR